MSGLPHIAELPPPGRGSRRLFYAYAGVALVCLATGLATEMYALIGLPVLLWVLAQAFLDFRPLFWLLLTMIPVSTNIFLPGGFGTDLPTEPLAIGLTGILILHAVRHWPEYDGKAFGHPIAWLLYLHIGWILFTTVFSEGILVSIKFSLAKLWYVGAYFLLPLLILKTPRRVSIMVHCLLWPLLFVAFQTLVRHGAYGFSFAMQHKTMHPFMSEHVSYAGCLATMTPWLFFLRWWMKSRGQSTWWWALLVLPIWLAAIYFSYTRAAFIALAMAAAAYYIIRWKLLKPALGLALAAGIAVAVYFVHDNRYLDYAPDFETTVSQQQFDNLITATYKLEDISTMERFYRWVAAGHMVPYRPITGWGPGNFLDHYKGYTVNAFRTYVSDNEGRSGIHSYYLMTLVEQGFPGLIIFLLYIFGALIIGERLYHQQTDPAARHALMAALLAMLVVDAFNIINDQMETDKVGAQYLLNLSVLVMMGNYRAINKASHNAPTPPSRLKAT
ncbi:O-antigen ligase family protein [Neolewinella agarilytica]|uniref:O-antigen ligase family protein n=1 Tax=Neolewinella agarilytica TaxID=478744 RepID=UPI0023520E12|nr:O-antigen ligase family protein [Neolewinella agarilytica]